MSEINPTNLTKKNTYLNFNEFPWSIQIYKRNKKVIFSCFGIVSFKRRISVFQWNWICARRAVTENFEKWKAIFRVQFISNFHPSFFQFYLLVWTLTFVHKLINTEYQSNDTHELHPTNIFTLTLTAKYNILSYSIWYTKWTLTRTWWIFKRSVFCHFE